MDRKKVVDILHTALEKLKNGDRIYLKLMTKQEQKACYKQVMKELQIFKRVTGEDNALAVGMVFKDGCYWVFVERLKRETTVFIRKADGQVRVYHEED